MRFLRNKQPFITQNIVTLRDLVCAYEAFLCSKTMHEGKTNIYNRRGLRKRLSVSLTCLAEAIIWAGCVYAAALSQGLKLNWVGSFSWLTSIGWGFVFLLLVTRFIPNNAYSRTARRDEVVACAMKVAMVFCVLNFAVFTERTPIQFLSSLFFCIALTAERLILNNCFIRYCMQPAHNEHAVLICREEEAWQQQALQQNTYGLILHRLEMQAAQQQAAQQQAGQLQAGQLLTDFLAEHPETRSVYCSSSALQSAELEAIVHICREQDIVLHLLPIASGSLPQTTQNLCGGSINILSPSRPPLKSLVNRLIKRLTDIVLSILILLTVFPVFALIAFICIKRQSRGPILVTRHVRGMNGKTFQSLTFRTRHYDAAPSFLDGVNDPGYFPFGKFLTHSKLELLPQFLCVLWGSMTIIGSQAMSPEQYTNYRQGLNRLFASEYRLKAGITSYHFAQQAKGCLEADVWYYRNWGFWLDLRIMTQRIGKLMRNSNVKSINYI